MFKTIEVLCTEVKDDKERLSKITEILAEGVYAYLKTNGYLKEDTELSEMRRLVEEKIACLQEHAKGQIEREIT